MKELAASLVKLAEAMIECARVANRYVGLFQCDLCMGQGTRSVAGKNAKCALCDGKGYQWPGEKS